MPRTTRIRLLVICAVATLSLPIESNAQLPEVFDAVVERVLDARGVDGAFILYDETEDRFLRYNRDRTRTMVSPASTFKILNSLIILETGAVGSVDEIVPWDGKMREFASWNEDQTLRQAIRRSTVWVYQALARKVGIEAYRGYLDAVGFGNGAVGERADDFWLAGPLMISPQQQVEFMRRLHTGDLPFSAETIATVKSIIVTERGTGWVLRGKTGLAMRTEPVIGWYVGYLETPEAAHYFALNVDVLPDGHGMDRVAITREILAGLGLLDE